jgi:hypothetical protein
MRVDAVKVSAYCIFYLFYSYSDLLIWFHRCTLLTALVLAFATSHISRGKTTLVFPPHRAE